MFGVSRRRSLVAAPILIVAALLLTFAVGSFTSASASEPVGYPHRPQVNIDRPFVDGASTTPTAAAATSGLAIAQAARSGRLRTTFIHGSASTVDDHAAVAQVYDNGKTHFDVIEDRTTMTEADLAGLAGCDHNLGCEGIWTMVTLADGTPALEIASPQTNGFIWLRDDRRYDVFGPTAAFTVPDALSAANEIEAASK